MTIDPQIITIGVIVLGVCAGGLILSFVLPLFGGILAIAGHLLEAVFTVIEGGPVAWCGCLFVLMLVFGCCLFVSVLSFSLATCGTPDAVTFCTWFGL
jgi:hypothetical protein